MKNIPANGAREGMPKDHDLKLELKYNRYLLQLQSKQHQPKGNVKKTRYFLFSRIKTTTGNPHDLSKTSTGNSTTNNYYGLVISFKFREKSTELPEKPKK